MAQEDDDATTESPSKVTDWRTGPDIDLYKAFVPGESRRERQVVKVAIMAWRYKNVVLTFVGYQDGSGACVTWTRRAPWPGPCSGVTPR